MNALKVALGRIIVCLKGNIAGRILMGVVLCKEKTLFCKFCMKYAFIKSFLRSILSILPFFISVCLVENLVMIAVINNPLNNWKKKQAHKIIYPPARSNN